MKKKGFTLIELLAVIVILAIIAVITVPKIADMISSSRMGGAEDSFYGTLKAAELGYTKALQSKTDLKGDTCDLSKASGDKVTCTNGTVISFTGKVPEKGIVSIDSNGATGINITTNGYMCSGDLSNKSVCKKTSEAYDSDTLKNNITQTGDGLYIDKLQLNRFIYKGENPNNYIKFNNENWRIISIEDDGTIKIILDGKLPTDRGYDNNSRNGSANTYCKLLDGKYYGCNAWGSATSLVSGTYTGTVTQNSSLNIYLNGEYYNSLPDNLKNKISNHKFNIGEVLYSPSLESISETEKARVWKGNVGLINYSDYYKATTNKECNPAKNGYYYGPQTHDKYPCSSDNYLFKEFEWFSIAPYFGNTNLAIRIAAYGGTYYWYVDALSAIRPVVYLKETVKLTGTGTSSDPYVIS